MAKITIYGTGYVALVTGVCLAEHGHEILIVDIDETKVLSLQKGVISIVEKDLPELLAKHQQTNHIKFTSNLEEAIHASEYHFIAVGTPEGKNGDADLTIVNAVASAINRTRIEPFIIIIKSTVPVGTAEKIRKMLLNEQQTRNQSLPFYVVSNPEFLREGNAIHDCLYPHRIILGAKEHDVLSKIEKEIYDSYIKEGVPLLKMDNESAELTKYAANALLATKISFMNELTQLSEKLGADIEIVRKGIGLDARIGPYFISPGCGYGGSCFPKDIKALLAMFEKNDCEATLLKQVPEANQRQMEQFCGKILRYLSQDNRVLSNCTVALWGLSFKPGTDDVRESPAINIANKLSKSGIKIRAYDPAAMPNVNNYPWISCASSPESVLKEADALIIATDWPVFKEIDVSQVCKMLKDPVIFDGRNMYEINKMKAISCDYFSIGRPAILGKVRAI